MGLTIQPIVEGRGEVESIRILLNRIVLEFCQIEYVHVLPPINTKGKPNLHKLLEDYTRLAAQKLQPYNQAAILVLLDCDDQCPAKEAPELLARVQKTVSHLPHSVVMANAMFENWFIAAATSISALQAATIPTNPESIQGAKAWLSKHLAGDSYDPVTHQASFSTEFNLHLARANAPSFDKLCRDLEKMFSSLEP